MYTITIEPVERRCAGVKYKATVNAPAGSKIEWKTLTAPDNVDVDLVTFEPQGSAETYFTLPFEGDYNVYAIVKTPS